MSGNWFTVWLSALWLVSDAFVLRRARLLRGDSGSLELAPPPLGAYEHEAPPA
jgi:hypothetical protein